MIHYIRARILGYLLHVANSDRRPIGRQEFYAIKDRILQASGKSVGFDMQEIVDACWDCDGKGCRRCFNGVYRRRRVWLERFELGGFTFHKPRPHMETHYSTAVTISGRVQHRDYGLYGSEMTLWFLLLFAPRLWARSMTASSYCKPGLWPLLRLQKIAMAVRMFWDWAKLQRPCYACGKPFRNWGLFWVRGRGSIYFQCKRCEDRRHEEWQSLRESESPF